MWVQFIQSKCSVNSLIIHLTRVKDNFTLQWINPSIFPIGFHPWSSCWSFKASKIAFSHCTSKFISKFNVSLSNGFEIFHFKKGHSPWLIRVNHGSDVYGSSEDADGEYFSYGNYSAIHLLWTKVIEWLNDQRTDITILRAVLIMWPEKRNIWRSCFHHLQDDVMFFFTTEIIPVTLPMLSICIFENSLCQHLTMP